MKNTNHGEHNYNAKHAWHAFNMVFVRPEKKQRTQVAMAKNIGIIGCGPSGLFMLKSLLETVDASSIVLFEANQTLGSGMPYSSKGANREHVTNVSGNEIPEIRSTLLDWVSGNSKELDQKYNAISTTLNDYKVLPRLLFGDYLSEQFRLLINEAKENNVDVTVYTGTPVSEINFKADQLKIQIIANGLSVEVDHVIICTGHTWPLTSEGKIQGFFDSPYPPSKLVQTFNHEIAITGSSLTAIDAIRTLARSNGKFVKDAFNRLTFIANSGSPDFRLVLFSRHGLLPAVRFHLDDPHLSKTNVLSKKELMAHREENNGFMSLDYIFEMDFKETLRKKDPGFYEGINQMNLESFVDTMMGMREKSDAFQFFKAEYREAIESIEKRKSVYWKEALAILSFSMNYPAKYLSAEDYLRLQKTLMPLISVIIAFVPQHSCEELIALHDAGRLQLIACGTHATVTPVPAGGVQYTFTDAAGEQTSNFYNTYVNCIGQKHLNPEEFPFRNLVQIGMVSRARLKFRNSSLGAEHAAGDEHEVEGKDGAFYLRVPGVAINDFFQLVDHAGSVNHRINIMAVPFIGGFNPDYSGLDFCEEASRVIAKGIASAPGA